MRAYSCDMSSVFRNEKVNYRLAHTIMAVVCCFAYKFTYIRMRYHSRKTKVYSSLRKIHRELRCVRNRDTETMKMRHDRGDSTHTKIGTIVNISSTLCFVLSRNLFLSHALTYARSAHTIRINSTSACYFFAALFTVDTPVAC